MRRECLMSIAFRVGMRGHYDIVRQGCERQDAVQEAGVESTICLGIFQPCNEAICISSKHYPGTATSHRDQTYLRLSISAVGRPSDLWVEVTPPLDAKRLAHGHRCKRYTSSFGPALCHPSATSASPWSPLAPRSVHRSTTSRQAHTSSPRPPRSEHRRVAQHIRHNEQSHVRAPNVDAVQMCDATITLCDVDVLELAVHVVFCFDEFAAVGLARVDLNRHLMALVDQPSAGAQM